MKHKALLCIGAVAYTLAAFTANGQSIEVKLISIDPSLTVNGTFDDGKTTRNYSSGVLQFTTTSLPSNLDFEAFCVEPSATIAVGQTLTYEVTSTSQLTNSEKVAKLVGGYLGSSKTKEDAAAFQWAIWEVTAENKKSFNLSNGNVRITSSGTNLATQELGNKYLAQIDSFSSADIAYLTNSKFQNMVGFKAGTAVPEPSTFGLAALAGVLLLRRKR